MTEEETAELRDALARVIDPVSWEASDQPALVKKPEAQDLLREDSREIADRIIESGLMASMEWDRKEYLNAKASIIHDTSRVGYCEDVPDGLDGYFRHDPKCRLWPDGAVGSSVDCIRPGRSR